MTPTEAKTNGYEYAGTCPGLYVKNFADGFAMVTLGRDGNWHSVVNLSLPGWMGIPRYVGPTETFGTAAEALAHNIAELAALKTLTPETQARYRAMAKGAN